MYKEFYFTLLYFTVDTTTASATTTADAGVETTTASDTSTTPTSPGSTSTPISPGSSTLAASTTTAAETSILAASLVSIQEEVGEMQGEVTEQANTLSNILSSLEVTESLSPEAIASLANILGFLNSMGPELGNIASLANGSGRESGNDCSLTNQTNTRMSAAIEIVEGIISLIEDLGLTGNLQLDTYLTLLKTEKEAVKVKLEQTSRTLASFALLCKVQH